MTGSRQTLDPGPAIGHDERRVWTRRCSAVAVVMISAAVLASMSPDLLLRAVTPTGGDMGAHVLGPAYLRDVLLPQGRIMGWSNHWFAGFPIFYFYFPLPSLVIVGLDLVLPYGVAFKLVSVMGLVALAPATYFLVRSMSFARPVAAVAAATGAAYAFMETPTPNIFGGTMASSLAGEFSYSWSFAFSLVYLGLLLRAVYDHGKYFPPAALALAATALCHVIPTMGVVAGSLVVAVARPWRVRRDRGTPGEGDPLGTNTRSGPWPGWIVAGTWLFGFVLAAFWALPLVIRLRYTTDMDWWPLSGIDELAPVELWPLALMGVFGVVAALRVTGRALPLAVLTVLPVPAYFLLGQGAKLWNGRALPHWFFGLHVFAGIAAGLLIASLVRRLPDRIPRWWIRSAVGVVTALVVFGPAVGVPLVSMDAESGLGAWGGWTALGVGSVVERISAIDLALLAAGAVLAMLVGRSGDPGSGIVLPFAAVALLFGPVFLGVLTAENYVPAWARWNYQGYEGKQTWPEYRDVMQTVAGLPPGRVQWEANSELNKYGTPMSPMLFPYWSEGTHPSMEGLYFESSVTTPFHFLNAAELSEAPSNPIPGLRYHNGDFERGVQHMALFDVAYYVAYTDEAKEKADRHPAFERLSESPPFVVYGLPEASLIDVALNRPWVFEEPEDRLFSTLGGIFAEDDEVEFVDVALDWYEDIGMLDQWVVQDGPDGWERIDAGMEGTTVPLPGDGVVSDIRLEDHRISFRTTAVGTPHLVKVSYFPNWTAYGAEGPWRAAPAFMVVVPTGPEVELRFEHTWVEVVGLWSSLVGAILLVTWWIAVLRRRKAPEAGPEGLRHPLSRGTGTGMRPGHSWT